MILSVEINNRAYKINSENPIDISIPLDFNDVQPNAYGVKKASSKPCEAGSLVGGDTRRGGSCNFEEYKFIPHCNGTHTECVGHIINERIFIHNCLADSFVPAILISLVPENANETNETYPVSLDETDQLITRKTIEKALESGKWKAGNEKSNNDSAAKNISALMQGLIVRTLPNSEDKLSQTYLDEVPPFFSTEAMQFLRVIGVKHLLVDLPSIDRIFDEGKLSNHRIFWNVEPEKFELNEKSLINNTITEMIFVPDAVEDGAYFLNLQIAAFAADASPSRPRLFKISPS